MANRVRIRARARLDEVELASYIGQHSFAAAQRFLDASESTFQFLADSPQLGGVFHTSVQRLHGLRVFRVQGFPNHLVFYLSRDDGAEIVRVLHGARDLEAALQSE